jgi:undecaprenyl-diphosphatase
MSVPLAYLVLLALIQGLTEFLPVSSSAHLILPSQLMGMPDQGPLIDVAVHVGSLFAVMLYFRAEVARLLRGVPDLARARMTADARLLAYLAAATVPTVAVGGVLYLTGAVDVLRNAEVIAWATILFGVLLFEADRIGLRFKAMDDLTWRGVLFIGAAQVLALIPGTSRAGITMTAGRFLGYERSESARFSMLLSLPTIAAFGVLAGIELARSGEVVLQANAVTAMALSFAAAFASIWVFMKWVDRFGFAPFVLYRLALGAVLLVMVYAV